MSRVDADLEPILGEFAWHSLTIDPTIEEVSAAHYNAFAEILTKHGRQPTAGLQVLEVASYAHITGYQLHQDLGVQVELFDISASTLRLGRQIAHAKGLAIAGTTRTMGDFHKLPYQDDQFDVVFICSALHHTWRWEQVLAEMIRVLAPGGLLFLENEPTKRDFCFGKFRTNRPANFTPFEKKLEELGMIRTIAEPFLGSRPETLFHMVENQTMPLRGILEAVESRCAILEVIVQPEMCMGPLEYTILEQRQHGAVATARWLTSQLTDLTEQARETLSDNDRGLGFALPSAVDISSLSQRTAQALARLSPPEDSWAFRQGLAEIFGAPLKLVARKRGIRRGPAQARLKANYPESDGVVIALSPEIARLLDPGSLLLPDIQTADQEVLGRTFPASDWKLVVSPHNIRILLPEVLLPQIFIPVPQSGSLLVIMRIYLAFSGRPYRVVVCHESSELSSFTVYQAESILLSNVLPCGPDTREVVLSLKTVALDGVGMPVDSLRINYIGAFML